LSQFETATTSNRPLRPLPLRPPQAPGRAAADVYDGTMYVAWVERLLRNGRRAPVLKVGAVRCD